MDKFWQMRAEAGSAGQRVTVLFYGDISFYPSWYEEDRSPYEIAEELKAYGSIEHITARFNSPGGSAHAGLAIGNMLRSWPAPVTTYVDGLAASAASMIFMAGDERVMPSNTLLYLHNPMTWAAGFATDLRKAADELDVMREAMIATYAEPSGLSAEHVAELVDADGYITAQRALELGLATSIERQPVTASMSDTRVVMNGLAFDPRKYRMVIPAEIKALFPAASAEEEAAVEDVELPAADEPAPVEEAEAEDAPVGESSLADETPASPEAAERERIQGILALAAAIPGSEALAQRAAYEEPMTVEAFALAAHTDPGVVHARQLAVRSLDAVESGVNGVHADHVPPGGSGAKRQPIAKRFWPWGKKAEE